MDRQEKIAQLVKLCSPCIVARPIMRYGNNGKEYIDYLAVVGESYERIGHSRGIGKRYDYGFMDLDIRDGINVIILS